jgi:hypothetical protein
MKTLDSLETCQDKVLMLTGASRWRTSSVEGCLVGLRRRSKKGDDVDGFGKGYSMESESKEEGDMGILRLGLFFFIAMIPCREIKPQKV